MKVASFTEGGRELSNLVHLRQIVKHNIFLFFVLDDYILAVLKTGYE